MIIKKFIPCIYLYHEHAVRNLTDTTIVDTDPVRLADYYCEHNADELIVFDMSEGDAEHEAALDIIKEICAKAEVDVIGAGNVKRMEDIKKLLYAGCKKAVLDYEKESNIEITEEVSLKFGKDKILISYNDPSVLELHKEKIEKYISAMILMNPHQIRETQAILSLPFFVQINQVALNKLLEIFAYENVCGVTGNTINDNVKEIVALKDLCRENDIPIESFQAAYKWEDFKKNSDGMVPVIVQDYRTQEVLMMAYMNEEAYAQTLKLGKMTYYSRSRQELWLKGLTSGHYQYVKELVADFAMGRTLSYPKQGCTGRRGCGHLPHRQRGNGHGCVQSGALCGRGCGRYAPCHQPDAGAGAAEERFHHQSDRGSGHSGLYSGLRPVFRAGHRGAVGAGGADRCRHRPGRAGCPPARDR